MATSKRDVLAQIETNARLMARTGTYQNFRPIQQLLVQAGYTEAQKLFQNGWQPEEINRICWQCFDGVTRNTQAA